MRYRLLGRSGVRVSELCLGAMVFGDERGGWGATREEASAILASFAEAGGNFVDTANFYADGESERIVGDLIRPDRDRWVLGTKYALSSNRSDPNAGRTHRKSLHRSIDRSLERLGTDYIDLYWVHIWDAYTQVEEVISALDDLVRAGKGPLPRDLGYPGMDRLACGHAGRAAWLESIHGPADPLQPG
jgi:aryl-alcohol dehydrogenase-like predicted oxidoreductase